MDTRVPHGFQKEVDSINTLTLKPHGSRIVTYEYPARRLEFEAANESVQATSINPKVIFELTYSGTYENYCDLRDFHAAQHGGVAPFYWTDGEGVLHTVRFATNDLKLTQKMGYKDDGSFGVVAYESTVQLRKVW